jgi:hypothetical protein
MRQAQKPMINRALRDNVTATNRIGGDRLPASEEPQIGALDNRPSVARVRPHASTYFSQGVPAKVAWAMGRWSDIE